ncbi:MAG: endonuclease/exonuclease/phosphatase family protein [Pseudomonadota bacterium]
MSTKIRLATFNLENLDDTSGRGPTLAQRIAVMRPQLERLEADILCLQEVNGQEQSGQPRQLLALEELISGTAYEDYNIVSTKTSDGVQVYDKRNLVILSHFDIAEHQQYKHSFLHAPAYRKATALPEEDDADKITWERPILYTKLKLGLDTVVHVINLHLKSRLASSIPGQQLSSFTWKSAAGWAEGFFVSSMKRVGQALETRILIDSIFDENNNARIAVCGDFNAESLEVPVEAIRGSVENTGNAGLGKRVMVPCEHTIPESL